MSRYRRMKEGPRRVGNYRSGPVSTRSQSKSDMGISRQYCLYVKQNGSLGSLTQHFCKKSLQIEREPVLSDADRRPVQIYPGRDLEGIHA
jgi:hypothetical protein